MQFARTGDPDYLHWANVCARHFMDVDQVHYSGELHYHGYTDRGDYHEEPEPCDMAGHPYISGIVNHYMLTGDRRAAFRAYRRGLALDPVHKELRFEIRRLGLRRRPVFRFLGREHPINRFVGRLRQQMAS